MAKLEFDLSGVVQAFEDMQYFVGKWTPVSEGPPKEDGDYLAYIIDPDDPKWSYIMTARYETPNCFEPSGCWSHDVDLVSDNVVCWMPLPKVPLEIIDKEMAKLKGEKNEQS